MQTIRKYSFLIVLMLIAAALTGCVSADPVLFESNVQSMQDEKYNIQVRVVSSEELKRQAGRNPSPFVIEPGLFDPREYVVFEVVIQNKSEKPAGFDLNDLEMHLAAGRYYTKNAFQVKQYWASQDDVDGADKRRMATMAERYMLPREVNVPAGGLKRGYAVFLANVPKYGEMTIFLPMLGAGFRPDVYEFTFAFTKI